MLYGKLKGCSMTYTETLAIDALAPFSLDLSAQIFMGGDRKVRSYKGGCFSQVVNADGKLVLAKLCSSGTVDRPELRLELHANDNLSAHEAKKAEQVLCYIFNLNLPLSAFYEQVKADPIMSQITQKLYGFKFPTTPTVFEALVDAIVEQQISIKVARTIEERLAVKFGEALTVNGENYFAFPTPQLLAKAGADEIRQVGLSQRKADYIYGAAQLIVEGKLDLEHLKNHKSPEQIIVELDEIKGIGVWTAELTMLRGMQRLDALPADDFGIRRVISRYYCCGRTIKAAEAREIAEAWGNWKGLAAFYLIVAEAQGITL
jgi:DNA-3-methyladenine glycosylase II